MLRSSARLRKQKAPTILPKRQATKRIKISRKPARVKVNLKGNDIGYSSGSDSEVRTTKNKTKKKRIIIESSSSSDSSTSSDSSSNVKQLQDDHIEKYLNDANEFEKRL